MANEIQFPTSPTNGNIYSMGGRNYRYDSAQDKFVAVATATIVEGGGVTIYATIDDLPLSGNTQGDLAHVTANNTLYFWNGSGWYKIALINNSPSISNVNSSYTLSDIGADTVITIVAEDPEGLAITYSIASDTSGNTATVVQGTGANTNIFTITPSTDVNDNGTFSLTFRASDGVNIATAPASFTLNIIVVVENSNYTSALFTTGSSTNNNTFIDSSTNSHTITAAGNVTHLSFSPYRHGGYSTYFDGSGDYLSVTNDTSLTIGTGDFTAECWIFVETGATLTNYWRSCFALQGDGNATAGSISIYMDNGGDGYPAGSPAIIANGNSYRLQSNADMRGQWTHVAVARQSGTMRFFVNGTLADSTTDNTNYNATGPTTVGVSNTGQSNYWLGYIADARFVKGTAVYTSAFTPPIERLTAITNTSLLTCHLPYIADGSTNGHTITVNGNTKTEPFAPYEYNEYSATDNGGSIYFDGSGDYLSSTITGPGTGDFTYEFWYYPTNSSFSGTAFNTRSSENSGADGFDLNLTSTSIQATYTNVIWLNASTSAIKAFSWNHIALVRNSGTVTIYVNGISVGTASQTSNFSSTSFNLFANVLNNTGLSGNVTDFRYATTAVYTSNFTPPTTPLTAITNTSLLLNGTNAGIIDKSQSVQTLTLSGDVKSSTTQTKYLSSSMYFDGSGDRISFPGNDMVNISSGDFTVEGWVHPTTSAFIKIFTMFTTTNANYAGLTFGISRTTSTTITVECGSPSVGGGAAAVSISSSGTALNNAWSHIAFTREGNTFTLWVNGASEGTATFSGSLYWSPPNVYIGSGNDSAPSYFTGYLSDFRITKGLARYTANFTPPASELKG